MKGKKKENNSIVFFFPCTVLSPLIKKTTKKKLCGKWFFPDLNTEGKVCNQMVFSNEKKDKESFFSVCDPQRKKEFASFYRKQCEAFNQD